MHHSAIFGCKGTQKKLLALAYQALGVFWQLALQILKLKHIVNCNICYSIETLYIIYKYIQGLKLAKESFDLTYSDTDIYIYIYIYMHNIFPLTVHHPNVSFVPVHNTLHLFKTKHSSGAVWESRWTSWAVRPNEPSGFCGRKDLLYRALELVTTCP